MNRNLPSTYLHQIAWHSTKFKSAPAGNRSWARRLPAVKSRSKSASSRSGGLGSGTSSTLPVEGNRLAVDLLAFRIQIDFQRLAALFVNQLQDQPVFQGTSGQADSAIVYRICGKKNFRNFRNAGGLFGGREVNERTRLGHGKQSLRGYYSHCCTTTPLACPCGVTFKLMNRLPAGVELSRTTWIGHSASGVS